MGLGELRRGRRHPPLWPLPASPPPSVGFLPSLAGRLPRGVGYGAPGVCPLAQQPQRREAARAVSAMRTLVPARAAHLLGDPSEPGRGAGSVLGRESPPGGEEGRAPQGGQCFWVTGVRVERPWSDLTDAASEGFCRQASACGHTRTPRASAEGRLGHSTAPGSGVRARCVALTECPSGRPCWARSVVGSRRPGGRPPSPRAASGGRC